MKYFAIIISGALLFASCSGGSGGGGASNNDQTNPSDNDTTSTPTGRVTCLMGRLRNLPTDQKKVIELSAQAVIACKATEADVKEFIKKRKQ